MPPGPASLFESGKMRAGCPGPCPADLSYLQGWRLYNSSGQPGPVFGNSHRHRVVKCAEQQVLVCIAEVHTPKMPLDFRKLDWEINHVRI